VERCFQFTVAWTRSVLSIGLNDCRLGFHGYRYHGVNQFLQYYASEFTYPPRVLNAYGKVAYLRRMVASSRTLSQLRPSLESLVRGLALFIFVGSILFVPHPSDYTFYRPFRWWSGQYSTMWLLYR